MRIEAVGTRRPAPARKSGWARLTALDLMQGFVRREDPAWPGHFGGLAIVDAKELVDASGQLRLPEIRARLDRRLVRVPQLRRRLYVPGPLRGGPIWVDDQRFAIEHHAHEMPVESPGGDEQLLDAAVRLYGRQLDRSRPLWELWFLTGLSDGRLGVLLKLHHSVADGSAAVAVMGSLFDPEPDAPDPVSASWSPEPIPGGWALFADNLSSRIRTIGRGVALLAHPRRLLEVGGVLSLVARRSAGDQRAPRTSLNRAVRAGRRVRFLRLDLPAMKEVAHAHGGKVNDAVLGLWTGGLRQLLASRGELVAGLELVTSQAVSTRAATDGAIDNQVGNTVLRLPVWESDVERRLDVIVRATRKSKAGPRPAAIMGALAVLGASPIARHLALRQQAVNVKVSNVVGPPVPMYLLGARILDIVPIVQVFGNVGLALCAFSYAGVMRLVVTADATAFPDLDELMRGMERDWSVLTGTRIAEPVPA